jgi:putative transposase
MPIWVCYYHIIWSTKQRQPVITDAIEKVIIETAKRKSAALKSQIHAVQSVSDHIHFAVTIAPHVALAEWVRQIKGLTAHEVNVHFPNLPAAFHWQRGYCVLSYGQKHFEFVLAYVQNQKIHHAQNTITPYLEQLDPDTA